MVVKGAHAVSRHTPNILCSNYINCGAIWRKQGPPRSWSAERPSRPANQRQKGPGRNRGPSVSAC